MVSAWEHWAAVSMASVWAASAVLTVLAWGVSAASTVSAWAASPAKASEASTAKRLFKRDHSDASVVLHPLRQVTRQKDKGQILQSWRIWPCLLSCGSRTAEQSLGLDGSHRF